MAHYGTLFPGFNAEQISKSKGLVSKNPSLVAALPSMTS